MELRSEVRKSRSGRVCKPAWDILVKFYKPMHELGERSLHFGHGR